MRGGWHHVRWMPFLGGLHYYIYGTKNEGTNRMQEGFYHCIAYCLICWSSLTGQKMQSSMQRSLKSPKVGHLSGPYERSSSGLIRQTGEILEQERVSWSRLCRLPCGWDVVQRDREEGAFWWLDVQRQGGRVHTVSD